ncbi:hypothetical protein NDI56_06385 [Haloarcula sp. S1CR25-12]|uniref:Uncharacterized protein n=1 Tax=Haloarcula saliterrae TaxID=2950534 RepID=A0ABU2F9T2_9EURY|nr:hypothetical protein [Haloarcula sp. S1CR25-12]MDS0259019.1 hypothetical protein [Haloarcula sp. S1CR25-12]
MNRRKLLACCGGSLAALAGCLSASPSDSTEESAPGTERPTERSTATPTESASSVAVEDIAAQKAVSYSSMMGSGGVLAAADRQYVVASVTGTETYERPEFVFETDSETYDSGLDDTVGARNASVAGRHRPYVAFDIPSPLSASNPRIRRADDEDETWSLPDDAAATLAAPAPRFELDELTVPDSVSEGRPLSVSLTVTNVADTEGRFLAALYWPTREIQDDDESRLVERDVAAGETTTASLDIDTSYTASEDGPVTLSVRGHVCASREVTLQNASSP